MLDHYHQTRDQLLQQAESLEHLAEDRQSSAIARRLHSQVIAKLLDNRFNLVVVGEFNHGKSTLINAMLGAEVLPTGVTPTTALIHEVSFGETPAAWIVDPDGKESELNFEQLAEMQRTAGETEVAQQPGGTLVRVSYPSPLLRNQIVIVDTPGVNDLSLQRADITYNYVPRADAVLFLLDSGQLLKESERVFLREHLLSQPAHKIVFVVTKTDLLHEDELREAMDYVREQLGQLVGDVSVFPVSALRARQGHWEESGVGQLVGHLSEMIERERASLLLRHASKDLLDAARLLNGRLVAEERALRMSDEQLKRHQELVSELLRGRTTTVEARRSMIRESAAALHATIDRDAEHFRKDMEERIENIVENRRSREAAVRLEPLLKSSFEKWASESSQRVGKELDALAERIVALVNEDAVAATQRLGELLGEDMPVDDLGADGRAFDVGAITLTTFGVVGGFLVNWVLGGVLVVAMPTLAVLLRGKFEQQAKLSIVRKANEALEEAVRRATEHLHGLVDQFSETLLSWVESATQELHREVLAALKQASREKQRGEASAALAISACQRALEDLHAIEEKVAHLLDSSVQEEGS